MPVVHVNPISCNGCGLCVDVCPNLVLDIEERKVRVLNPGVCLGIKAKQLCRVCQPQTKICAGCVACVRNCPTGAISIIE